MDNFIYRMSNKEVQMERLTELVTEDCSKPFYRFSAKSGIDIRYRYSIGIEKAIDKLAEYENTGLTPQEITGLKGNANKVAIEKLEEVKHGIGEIDIRDDYTEAYWWQLERVIDELIAELKGGSNDT